MRAALWSMALAFCIAAGNIADAGAQQSQTGALCTDKPNLKVASASLGRVDYLDGGQAGSLAGGVLMVDFNISIENNGSADALRSRLRYSAAIKSLAGEVAEEIGSTTTDVYSVSAGETEDNLISIMVNNLRPLLQPSGELAGAAVFRVAVDVDNEINECDESDNSSETASEIRTGKVLE